MNVIKALIFLILGNALLFWGLEQYFFPEQLTITGGIHAYVYIAVIFGLINAILKPILMLLALPFRILTLGLVTVLLNGFLLYVLQESVNFLALFETTLHIDGLMYYLVIGFIVSFVNTVLHWFAE